MLGIMAFKAVVNHSSSYSSDGNKSGKKTGKEGQYTIIDWDLVDLTQIDEAHIPKVVTPKKLPTKMYSNTTCQH